jgi:hypothetical protein
VVLALSLHQQLIVKFFVLNMFCLCIAKVTLQYNGQCNGVLRTIVHPSKT